MTGYFDIFTEQLADAHHTLTKAVLTSILANDYAEGPDYSAAAQALISAAGQVAFAARELVRAIDNGPANEQPDGWNAAADEQRDDARAQLRAVQSLLEDTDGIPLTDEEEIPVGEIRRMIGEAVAR